MNYKIVVRPSAAQEIFDAVDWYEAQQAHLGVDFLDELEAIYSLLLSNPYTFSYYIQPVRSAKIKRFLYLVTYGIEGNDIVIYSIFMSEQGPSKRRIS